MTLQNLDRASPAGTGLAVVGREFAGRQQHVQDRASDRNLKNNTGAANLHLERPVVCLRQWRSEALEADPVVAQFQPVGDLPHRIQHALGTAHIEDRLCRRIREQRLDVDAGAGTEL